MDVNYCAGWLSFLLPKSSLEDCILAAPLADFTLPPKRNQTGKNAMAREQVSNATRVNAPGGYVMGDLV